MNQSDLTFAIFKDCLREAVERIQPHFIRLPTVSGTTIRERVFCYELYHQLRCLLPSATPFLLTGELDKSGHRIFKELSRFNVIPDLLLHVPGTMAGNFVAIEVKRTPITTRGLTKDLATLTYLRRDAQYQNALLLVFGATGADLNSVLRITKMAREDYHGRPIFSDLIELAIQDLGTGKLSYKSLSEEVAEDQERTSR
jgi:hypothetical protein